MNIFYFGQRGYNHLPQFSHNGDDEVQKDDEDDDDDNDGDNDDDEEDNGDGDRVARVKRGEFQLSSE